MNRSLKSTHVVLVAALAMGLSACSGGDGPSGAAPASTVTVTAPPSALPSPPETPAETGVPFTTPPEASTPSHPSPSVPGGRGTDATVLGQIALRGADRITVTPESDKEVEVLLTPFTVVLDVQGTVCDDGELPHRCSGEQLQKVLKKGGVLFAKVTIKDGTAIQIEEIVQN
ncbi:hypothetical protein FHS43_000631 [Streptosporangium becharense]|uniref:DUF5666 domain-containing protein n=1 Tax=Streptosporangium becharense TaxID=1816182 RepID=A0A7W9MGQ6_9ACTN|nr:hypothetical protein [Streptosporangium becharense]MBB2909385.1 hypothetical protein [Streptosporangium becharense]MBB5819658.1 hypothetical protein [Streptosporangium becharense]